MPGPAPRPTVLLVDDQASVRLALRTILEGDGYAVEEADSGQAALRICARAHLDLLVTDLVMPDCDGLELLRSLRRTNPGLPILVVTGADQVLGPLGAMASLLGAHRVLLKPVAVAEFRQAVRELINRGVAPPGAESA
jgi:CheY-like chemotaxis protein